MNWNWGNILAIVIGLAIMGFSIFQGIEKGLF